MTFALSNVGGAHMATNLKEMMDAANAAVPRITPAQARVTPNGKLPTVAELSQKM